MGSVPLAKAADVSSEVALGSDVKRNGSSLTIKARAEAPRNTSFKPKNEERCRMTYMIVFFSEVEWIRSCKEASLAWKTNQTNFMRNEQTLYNLSENHLWTYKGPYEPEAKTNCLLSGQPLSIENFPSCINVAWSNKAAANDWEAKSEIGFGQYRSVYASNDPHHGLLILFCALITIIPTPFILISPTILAYEDISSLSLHFWLKERPPRCISKNASNNRETTGPLGWQILCGDISLILGNRASGEAIF